MSFENTKSLEDLQKEVENSKDVKLWLEYSARVPCFLAVQVLEKILTFALAEEKPQVYFNLALWHETQSRNFKKAEQFFELGGVPL